MRRHTSVLMLFARSSFYKVLGVLAAMTAAECGIFYLTLRNGAEEIAQGAVGLEHLIALQSFVYVLSILAVLYVLARVGDGSGSREGYTLRRLGISEKAVVLWQWAYNTGCLLFVWMVQAMVAVGLCFWYLQVAPSGLVNHQTMVLAFYNNEFLHRLIPLSDFWSWVMILTVLPAFGLSAARGSYVRRWSSTGKSVSWWTVWTIWTIWEFLKRGFIGDPGSADVIIVLVGVMIMAANLFMILRKGVEDDEEKPEADA